MILLIIIDYYWLFFSRFLNFLNFFWGSNTNKCIGQVNFSQFFSMFLNFDQFVIFDYFFSFTLIHVIVVFHKFLTWF